MDIRKILDKLVLRFDTGVFFQRHNATDENRELLRLRGTLLQIQKTDEKGYV